MNKYDALNALRAKSITKVVIGFSGGNDEGGADGIKATYADGTEGDLLGRWDVQQDWQDKKWYVGYGETRREATPQERAESELAEALEQPIYDRWGGFAGEFHVYGTLTWNVTDGSVTMDGQESVETYESFQDSW